MNNLTILFSGLMMFAHGRDGSLVICPKIPNLAHNLVIFGKLDGKERELTVTNSDISIATKMDGEWSEIVSEEEINIVKKGLFNRNIEENGRKNESFDMYLLEIKDFIVANQASVKLRYAARDPSKFRSKIEGRIRLRAGGSLRPFEDEANKLNPRSMRLVRGDNSRIIRVAEATWYEANIDLKAPLYLIIKSFNGDFEYCEIDLSQRPALTVSYQPSASDYCCRLGSDKERLQHFKHLTDLCGQRYFPPHTIAYGLDPYAGKLCEDYCENYEKRPHNPLGGGGPVFCYSVMAPVGNIEW